MRMSSTATSGLLARAASTASSPSAASATTRMSCSCSTILRSPARTSAWSSASRTRITARPRRAAAARAPRSRRRSAGRSRGRRRTARRARASRPGRGRPAGPSPFDARAVVGDLDVELALAVAHSHARVRGACVLQGVRQRLLHDPVRRQVDARRDRALVALDPQLDRHARLAHLLDEVAEVAQARLRRERELVVGAPQHPEQPAHLGHRGAAGGLDRREHLARLRPLVAERPALGARLHDHDREVVRDDVVQLARDPRALLGDREPRRVVALVLELDRARGERLGELVAAAHDRRRAPDREQDAADEQARRRRCPRRSRSPSGRRAPR